MDQKDTWKLAITQPVSQVLQVYLSGLTLISTPAGTTMGLKEREWGQIGVINIQGTLGWIMEAPAATEYAVLPVGVEMIRPGDATD